MNIFRRTADIFSAHLNDVVDRFEEPERMLRHALREMDELLPATAAAVARSIATEKLLVKTRDEHVAQIEAWHARAADALTDEDEKLARRAIARKLEHQRALNAREKQIADAHEANVTLRRQLDVLREKHADARTKLTLLSAQQRAAQAQRQVLHTARAPLSQARAWSRFERFYQQVDLAQAETTALLELEAGGDADLESEFDRRTAERAIDDELLKILARRASEGAAEHG